MSDNPLIAGQDDSVVDKLLPNFTSDDAFTGGGLFGDAAQTVKDAASGDGVALALDYAADAMDALGFIENPMRALLASPIGWLIEHIGFLKEPLDQLAGDPNAVRAQAQTWLNLASALETSSAHYVRSADALAKQNSGSAVDSYRRAASNYATAVGEAAGHARNAAKAFEVAGAAVGTCRGIIRDNISEYVAQSLITYAVAQATAGPTAGGSIAAWLTSRIAFGATLAAEDSTRVFRLIHQVTQISNTMTPSQQALRLAQRQLLTGAARALQVKGVDKGLAATGETKASIDDYGDADTPSVNDGSLVPGQ